MVKRLTKTGNSIAVVLDRTILEAAHLDLDSAVEVSTDGHVIVIAPVKDERQADKLRLAEEWAHAQYGGAFRKLAK